MRQIAKSIIASVGLALSTLPAFADGRDMEIINLTDFEIVAFFGVHKDSDGWGADMLGGQAIAGGLSHVISFEDGSGYCIYSFKAVFDDGEELVSNDINICDLASFTYY